MGVAYKYVGEGGGGRRPASSAQDIPRERKPGEKHVHFTEPASPAASSEAEMPTGRKTLKERFLRLL